MIRILIADDHAVVAEGLRSLIDAQGDMRVVGLAVDGNDAVEQAAKVAPDLVVMDNVMPELNGIEATRIIRKEMPHVRVLMLSMHSTSVHVRRALGAGANGYVLKESVGRELLEAIRSVHSGRRYLSRQIADVVIDRLAADQPDDPLEKLSIRERQVLQLMAEGHSVVEIALKLSLSRKTVETYRSRMMDKLGVDELAGLVKFAIQHHLVTLD